MNQNNQRTKHLSLAKVIISLFMTLLVWTVVTNAWNYTELLFHAQPGSWTNYIYGFFSRFVWAAPAIALLHFYKNEIPTDWKHLFTNKPDMKPFIISVVVIVSYNVGSMFYNHGGLWINPDFHFLKHFTMFIMVGFAEELVYRGWGLNALSAFVSERKANVISTIFFILVHLPAYFIKLYLDGTFPAAAIAVQCAFALVLGLLFGYLYRKGKSLWSCMFVHFLSDFLGVMLIN